jgi:anti-sigma factor RsiW
MRAVAEVMEHLRTLRGLRGGADGPLTCQEVEDEQLAEDYLRGGLTEPQRDVFEAHSFECAHCLERVVALRALRAAMAGSAGAVARPPRVLASTLGAAPLGMAQARGEPRGCRDHDRSPGASAFARPGP